MTAPKIKTLKDTNGRGMFIFKRVGPRDSLIRCSFEGDDLKEEHLFQVHESHLERIIEGLTALK